MGRERREEEGVAKKPPANQFYSEPKNRADKASKEREKRKVNADVG